MIPGGAPAGAAGASRPRRGLFLEYWLPVLLYVGLIFSLSSIHGSSIPTLFPNVDKLEHLLEYSLLGLLAGRAIRFTLGGGRRLLAVGGTLGMGALVGALDELYQRRVPGRSSDPTDWLTDIAAVGLAILFTQVVSARSAASLRSRTEKGGIPRR